jgi:hypothetical protein
MFRKPKETKEEKQIVQELCGTGMMETGMAIFMQGK